MERQHYNGDAFRGRIQHHHPTHKSPKPQSDHRISRPEALRLGAIKYQGEPCARGHSGKRYTASGSCVDCVATVSRARASSGFENAPYMVKADRKRRELEDARLEREFDLDSLDIEDAE